MKIREWGIIGVIILLVGILSYGLGVHKVGLSVDEVWNYGLANNIGSITPNIVRGQEYTGFGPFEDFLQVKKGEGVNYINVWQNQANDVHPPLYYIVFHTVCSFFQNSFSKWYGIAVNVIWMIFIIYFLYKLTKDISGSIFTAGSVITIYGTSVVFLNTLMFIRMYTQFTFFALILAYLVQLYWSKQQDRIFYISLSLILILGLLTHYYFMIYAFFLCAFYAIELIRGNRFKELRISLITVVGSAVVYLLLWYHIAGHLFRGYRGKEAFSKAFSMKSLFSGGIGLLYILNDQAFCGTMILFVVIGFVLVCISIYKKERLIGYKTSLLLSCILYVFLVGKIAPFISVRYIMCTSFAFIMIAFIDLEKTINILMKNKRIVSGIAALIIFMTINVANLMGRRFYVPDDNYDEEYQEIISTLNDRDAVVYIADDWNAFYFYNALINTKSYTFVDEQSFKDATKERKEYVLMIYSSTPENLINELNCDLIYQKGAISYFLVN